MIKIFLLRIFQNAYCAAIASAVVRQMPGVFVVTEQVKNAKYAGDSPAVIGIFIALAAAFQAVEGFFPRPLPWLRLGLGNMAVLVALITMGSRFAFKVFLGKVMLGSFLLGTFLSPAFYLSLGGGFVSWAVMSILYRPLGKLTPVGISVSGAIAHGLSQTAVAYFILIRHTGIFYLLPLIIISSVMAGWITGLAAKTVSVAIAAYADRKIYLVSTSERRISILKTKGVPVLTVAPETEEDPPLPGEEPGKYALRQAEKKLESVLDRLQEPGIAVSADTVVECGGKIYLKPDSPAEADGMIKELNSKVQTVYTAVLAENLQNGRREKVIEKTILMLKTVPEEEIKKLSDKNLDKAGGYALQGLKDKYIKWMKGSYLNAVGFPAGAVSKLIKKVSRVRLGFHASGEAE